MTNLLRTPLAALLLAACVGGDPLPAPSDQTPVQKVAGLQITPLDPKLVPQGEILLTAIPLDDAGTPVSPAPPVSWTSSDPSIASLTEVGPGNVVRLRGQRSGQMILTASTLGVSSQVVVTVDPEPQSSGGLAVIYFHLIEYQYESDPGQYYYAPQLRVAETSGSGSVDILGFTLTDLPGLLSPIPPVCASYRLRPGAVEDLFTETYGDFDVAFFGPGRRAVLGATATVQLAYRTGSTTRSLTLTGPVVPGSLPVTYSGGRIIWSSCGR